MKALTGIALAATAFALVGCHRAEGGSTAPAPARAQPGMDAIAAVPLGDVIGGGLPPAAAAANPYANQPEAVAQGRTLFVRMNCAGCHGYKAAGGMGPSLQDGYWRYGGSPVSLFKSIYEGRPQGMPAWNPALPPDEIWKLVAYLQSLGGSFPPAAFEAAIEGDRAGNNVPSEVRRTLPADAKQPKAVSATAATSPPEARPDAGG